MMIGKDTEGFDGFIMPDRELVSIKDVDRVFSIITGGNEDLARIKKFLHALAQECLGKDYHKAAYGYYQRLLSLSGNAGEQVTCLSMMGVAGENGQNYAAALAAYTRALMLPQDSEETWYFLNNNAAYCLNHFERHGEAEKYCRTAIEINPNRHNAYKNLGIALQNLGQHVEAARSFMRAARLCSTDGRALEHLQVLITAHPEVAEAVPEIMGLLEHNRMRQENEGEFRLQ